jgi:frataxin-like iron-binding protein CyaY
MEAIDADIAAAVAPKLDSTTAATTYAPISGSSNYSKPRKAKLVGFGHSHMYYNFGDAAWQPLRPNPASRGQIMQANSMLGHRFDWINRGVGGEDTGAWLARLTNDLVNVEAGYAAISGPTNDVTNIDAGNRTVAQTKAAYNQIWDACASSGKYIFQETAPPRDSATTNQKNLRSELNNWLRSQQSVRKDFVIVDIERATMDPTTNAFVSGYSWDGVHLATPGAVAAGAEYARKMAIVIPERQITLPAADPRNLLKNNGGAFIGTTTAVPTGWSAVGATGTDPSYDRVAFTDRPGQKLKIVMPNGSIRFYRSTTLQQSLSEFAPGDVVRFSVAYEATGLDTAPAATTQAIYATLERNSVTVAIDLEWSADANPNGVAGTQNENMGSMARSGVLRTPTYTVPAGSGQTLAATFQARGGGTYHFWNPTIEKVSA